LNCKKSNEAALQVFELLYFVHPISKQAKLKKLTLQEPQNWLTMVTFAVCQIAGLQTSSQQPLRPQLKPQLRHFSFFVSLSISGSFHHSNVTGVHWDHFLHLFVSSLVGIG
jgi:hypothetical protein